MLRFSPSVVVVDGAAACQPSAGIAKVIDWRQAAETAAVGSDLLILTLPITPHSRQQGPHRRAPMQPMRLQLIYPYLIGIPTEGSRRQECWPDLAKTERM